MKTDLSSQITLTRIPQRYYRPENAFEHSVLTRLEKIPTNIYESADEGSFAIAKEIADQIRKKQEIGENFVMAIPGGRSPLSVYKELIRMHKEEQLSFRNVVVFVEYEFFPLVSPSAGNVAQLKEALLDHIDIAPENVYAPDGCMPKDAIIDFCRMYEENIQKAGGLDYILLGVGRAGKDGQDGRADDIFHIQFGFSPPRRAVVHPADRADGTTLCKAPSVSAEQRRGGGVDRTGRTDRTG